MQRRSAMRRLVFVSLCVLLLFGGLFFIFMPSYRGSIRGTVIQQSSQAPATPSRRYLAVRLDDGTTVQAGLTGRANYSAGRRVMVKEITNRVFGYKWYQITGPVDDRDGAGNRSSQNRR